MALFKGSSGNAILMVLIFVGLLGVSIVAILALNNANVKEAARREASATKDRLRDLFNQYFADSGVLIQAAKCASCAGTSVLSDCMNEPPGASCTVASLNAKYVRGIYTDCIKTPPGPTCVGEYLANAGWMKENPAEARGWILEKQGATRVGFSFTPTGDEVDLVSSAPGGTPGVCYDRQMRKCDCSKPGEYCMLRVTSWFLAACTDPTCGSIEAIYPRYHIEWIYRP